jgi:hypothetical protein
VGRPEQSQAPDQLQESDDLASDQSGTEDVLDGDVSEPPQRPKGRTWRTKADYVAVVLIVVSVLVAGLLVWQFSDARATTSQTGSSSVVQLPQATQLPPTLAEVWRAPSVATQGPVTVNSVVVTGDGGTVTGRDPLTGDVRWTYSRDLPLCTVSAAWNKALAVYRKDTNCSEVSTLDPASGKRGPQRNGDAALGTRLLSDGSHVITTGGGYFEVYRRDDLVKSLEFGNLRAPVNPNKQPRPGCTYGSFAVTTGKIAVVERCPGQDPNDRLTVLKPNPEKSDEPQVISSSVLGAKGARVVAVTAKNVAVALPGPNRLVVLDADSGGQVAQYPLNLPDDDLAGDAPNWVVPTSTGTAGVFWQTGSSTIALSATDLSPMWTSQDTIGTGVVLAGRLLVPAENSIRVLDQTSGQQIGSFPVNREGYQGQVQLSTAGSVVLEQRGPTVVALR